MKFRIGSSRCPFNKCGRAAWKKLQATVEVSTSLYTALFFSYNLLSRYFLFVYGLYKHSQLDWRPVVSIDWNVVNNELRECEKKRPWHTLRYFPDFAWKN